MRDIQMVLERWGAWAANNHEDVTWSSIAAGFKGLIPSKVKSRPQPSVTFSRYNHQSSNAYLPVT